MNWDFKSAEELLDLCSEKSLPISEVMIRREMQLGETRREAILDRIDASLRIMNTSVDRAISDPVRSMGGLIGGEAKRMDDLDESKLKKLTEIY
jgi:L-serine dehydratase